MWRMECVGMEVIEEHEPFSRNVFIFEHLLFIIRFVGPTFFIITGTIIWLNISTVILTILRFNGGGGSVQGLAYQVWAPQGTGF
jgi:hypothetical protein